MRHDGGSIILSSAGTGKLSRIDGKMDEAIKKVNMEENLLKVAEDLRGGFTFKQNTKQ